MGWRSPISSGPTASRLHNNEDDASELSVFEGTKLFTKRRICWLIGMLGQVGVTVYFVRFLEPGGSINRTPGIPWTPEHEAAWVNATISRNNSSTTNITNTTNLTSLQPSQPPSLMPTVSEETNVAEAFMVLEPLGLELPSDASFSWTVATSSTIQQSILEHERISVFFVQTRIIQQMVVVGGVIHEGEDGNSNSTNNLEGRQRQLQMKKLQRNLNSEDAVLIHFETTFFSGTYEKSALEQELVDAFADPERVQQYLLDLQQSNSFFLFQALQDATVYIEFDQATFPPSASPSTIPTTSSEPTMMPSTSAPMMVMPPPTTTPTMTTDVSTSPPTSTAPVVVPTQPPTPLPTPPPVPSPTPPPTFPPTPTPPTPIPTPIPTTAAPVIVNPPPTPPPTNPPPPLPTPPPTTAELPLTVLGDFELLEEVPHDVTSFTQGLELVPNSNPTQYYESIGLYGEGAIQIVDLNSGVTLQEHIIDPELFAFGITKYNTQLLQLTWRAGYGFIYDATTLAELGTFPINTTKGEGWGICHDTTVNTQRLYVSDGTTYLHTWDATTKELLSKVQVTKRTDPTAMAASTVRRVNELEWDRFSNTILANVWQKEFIIRIDPQTGFVTHQYDLESLERPGDANVLNGIALTDTPNEIWVTGKLWPSMYRIRLL